MMTNSDTKMLLKMSKTFDQADNILNKSYCKTYADKIEYLQQLFPELENVELTDRAHDDYQTLVMSVIHSEDNEPYMWGYRDGLSKGEDYGYEDCVAHVIKDWNTLRLLSQEGVSEHFKRILHKEIEDIT